MRAQCAPLRANPYLGSGLLAPLSLCDGYGGARCLSSQACPGEWSGRHLHSKERFGHEFTEPELKVSVDALCLDGQDGVVELVGSFGWTCVRHSANALRGDAGSVLSRQRSIDKVGLLLGLR